MIGRTLDGILVDIEQGLIDDAGVEPQMPAAARLQVANG
jgi:hypothetical protein